MSSLNDQITMSLLTIKLLVDAAWAAGYEKCQEDRLDRDEARRVETSLRSNHDLRQQKMSLL